MPSEYATTKDWVEGPGDLKEVDVEDVPYPGQKVRVRGLPAAYSNQASSEALEMKQAEGVGGSTAKVNTARLEVLQFTHGVIKPTFTEREAELIAEKYGPAFKRVIEAIDTLSGLDKESLRESAVAIPASGVGEDGPAVENGTPSGPGRSDVRGGTLPGVGSDGG